MALFAVCAIAPAAAQKVNVASIEKAIEKSEEDIADEKKGVKYATWLKRGDAYLDAVNAPIKSLFRGMDRMAANIALGTPNSESTATISGNEFQLAEYPFLTLYYMSDKLVSWQCKSEIKEGAIEEAIASYSKAYQMDEKSYSKVNDGLSKVVEYLLTAGDNANAIGKTNECADLYVEAYHVQTNPGYTADASPDILLQAGYYYTLDGANNSASYQKGIETLTEALENGYQAIEDANSEMDDEARGNIYYYLFHCYYGLRESDASLVIKAKDLLLEGIQKYPRNSRILEALMTLYTTEKSVGDPRELITLVDNSIAADPENADLWFGRGSIYNALKEYDECIASFEKYVELRPDALAGYYYLGLFYVHKGDQAAEAMVAKSYSSQNQYNTDLEAINDIYNGALAPLEKAYELDATDYATVSMLKALYFRLRDRDGYMDKYNKYNEAFKSMEQ